VKSTLAAAAFSLVVSAVAAPAADPPLPAEPLGRTVYNRHCAVCHGIDGRGSGVAASLFVFTPRDFTKGVYKFRSTASGQLPTDEDLKNSIVRGLPGSGMVPQDQLNDEEVGAVLAYVKSFSPRFEPQRPARLARLPEESSRESAPVERGRQIYLQGGCPECHGDSGRGDGPAVPTLSVPPADLTRRPMKSGPTPRDIVRTIVTGLDGTPMPSYDLMFDDADVWALAYYVESLATAAKTSREEKLGWQVEERELRPIRAGG
jgi:cytochrome c oxidase cbb3-type subunit 2